MDRLQKKCFIVTATTHGLLVGVMLFGAALMPARDDENNVKLLTAYDPTKVTDALSTGGDPNVKVPEAPQNPQPKPADPTPPPPKPEPPVTKPTPKPEPPEIKPEKVEPPKVIHPVKNDIPKLTEEKPKNPRLRPEDLMPITQKNHNSVKPDLKEVKRKSDDKAKAAREAADAAARAQRRKAAHEFDTALRTLGHDLSAKTLVAMSPGPGGGGEVSASYRDVIMSKYYNAWVVPTSLDDDAPIVVAKVTIARNGDVVNAHIIKGSGNSAMDRSVENALETVTFIEPFPESSKDQERTVTIQFNLQAKRQIG